MSNFKVDGDFTVASAFNKPQISFPIMGDTTAQIIEQGFRQFSDDFAPLALNTPHPTITDAYLVSEGQQQSIGGGVIEWVRTYATVPATRSDWESFSYRFIGYLGSLNPPYNQYYGSDPTGRDPKTVPAVPSRLEYKYFLIGAGQTYTTPRECIDAEGSTAQEYTLVDNTEAIMDYLFDAGTPGDPETLPSLTTYKAWVSAGTEIVAEDSRIERYQGNIWQVVTRYIAAQ